MNSESPGEPLVLTMNGSTEYSIVIPVDSSVILRRAASILADTLNEATGAEFPIVVAGIQTKPNEILIGATRMDTAELVDATAGLDTNAFKITTGDDTLRILGGEDASTLNGVYAFLENHLGCRWWTSDARSIPSTPVFRVGPLDETHRPSFDYREVFYRDGWYSSFSEPNLLNGQGTDDPGSLLKELHRGWGTWCHTFAGHVPPDRYFESNPEYFALVHGKRIPDGQLCLTNPAVFDLVVADLRRMMAEMPEAKYWSVSQNDCIRNCCCDTCAAIDEREESPMGSMLEFVNRVAAEFPDKIISTLAYQYTRKPPRTIRPAENVHIMLCSIECNRSRPIATDSHSVEFRNDVVSWAGICENIFVWDYVIQFSHLVSPFPNLRVLGPNMRFFHENRARGIFPQGNREIGGEFAELRAWLLAKLTWDVDYDVEKGIDEFLHGYYGNAAEPLREYINTMHDALEASGEPLRIFGGPEEARPSYLTDDLIDRYTRLFDDAEAATRDVETTLFRVKTARLPLQYAQLQLKHGDVKTRTRILDEFAGIAKTGGLEKVEEWKYTVDEFVADTRTGLATSPNSGKQ